MKNYVIALYKKEQDEDFILSLQQDLIVREAFNLKGLKDITLNKDAYSGCLVAKNKLNVNVGFVYFYFHPLDSTVYVSCIGVISDYRKKGIGLMLLKEMETFSKFNWPFQKIYAFTLENTASEHLFEKAGFSNYGEYKDFVFINGRYKTQRMYVKLNKTFNS